ncbi:MAG: alanine--tRNA ligase, partial [Candidatus Omnitrophica bacterium]|nr:alanine--tRNA ligase [Candidatus Omnitrophota bacterium]
MQTDEIRKKFLDFFSSKEHRIFPSSSLVPQDDPTVLFTTAGMNQFKEQFLGKITDFRRAASCQKCLRTDDLDKVGKTPSHHTFFEMLGNFSFGDYFKEEAITWAWEFVTQVLKISVAKLWVSVYLDDNIAYEIWEKKIKMDRNRIIRLGQEENFWPSNVIIEGPNGPCGPCSEIFFDQGEKTGCGKKDCNPSCNCGRFVEIWNLVFTQYNRLENESGRGYLKPLPQQNIDTGMGLERISAVMQGVLTNFEIDILKPIVKEIKAEIRNPLSGNLSSIYAIADHTRAVVFAIGDGVLPSNEERGYVVRKLIRRAFWYGHCLGIKKEFLYRIVPIVTKAMSVPYPELEERRENISQIILAEEKRFQNTLEEGLNILDGLMSEVKKKNNKV